MSESSQVVAKGDPQVTFDPPKAQRFPLQLGKVLHAISKCKYAFWVLGIIFQARCMFFAHGATMLDALNSTLLMYGIAMSFESLGDNEAISEKRKKEMRKRPWISKAAVSAIFCGGLFSIAVGILQFFFIKNRDLAWAITTFGLGMVALGRQQYDQMILVFKSQSNETACPNESSAV